MITEISPPIPREIMHYFEVNSLLLPGYRLADNELERPGVNKNLSDGEKASVLEQLAAANEYYESHRNEIAMYDKAEQYLKGVLQEHFDPKKLPPIKKWQAEIERLTAERGKLNQRYYALKDEVKEAEHIRKSVYSIMRQEQREQQPRRAHDIER